MPEADSKDIPQVQDRRPKITGMLPKNAQSLALGGIALLMVVIILFSGGTAPKPRKASTPGPSDSIPEPNPARIQDYRARIEEQARKLAAEESQLAQTKSSLGIGSPPAPNSGSSAALAQPYGASAGNPAEAERNWIELDRRKREYQSLFASNIALSHRNDPPVSVPSIAPVGQAATGAAKNASEINTGGAMIDGQAGRAASKPPVNSAATYRLFEGTILETVLTNRLDSSFSGPVNCMVTTNVYSHDGQKLLIPQGSRVLGEVRKLESFGEQRLAVSFHRVIMPDGYSLSFDQFKGLDQIGETGLRDQVNHHYLQIFGVSIAIGAIAGLSQANTRYSLDESAAQAYQQGVAASLSQSALHILDRYLNVLPTFTVREGYRIKVYLSQDLMLPAYDQHAVRSDL